MTYDSDSSSSGYSSDDDYLTSMATSSSHHTDGGKAAEEEREAIIRRKLMESFYGSSEAAPESLQPTKPKEKKRENQKQEIKKEMPPPKPVVAPVASVSVQATEEVVEGESTNTNSNLNSSAFDAHNHTQSLLMTCDTENLLQHNETLSMNVRHLDSTMQTLVYENYSKFIDATDAVRSINQSVDQSAIQGLFTLQNSIQSIQSSNFRLNQQVHPLRQAVAEKLEIKHHLERLKDLLHLPQSLQQCVQSQNYRTAMTRHAQAVLILSQHSNGLESLLKIEQECQDIMKTLIKNLMGRLLSWSGRGREYWRLQRGLPLEEESSNKEFQENISKSESWNQLQSLNQIHDMSDSDEEKDSTKEEEDEYKDMEDDVDLPPLPKTVAEIYECAGSFDLLTQTQIQMLLGSYSDDFTSDNCKPLALDAIERMLERDLDHHRMNLIHWKYDGLPSQNDGLDFSGNSINLDADMGRMSLEKATSATSGRARQVLREQFSSLSEKPNPTHSTKSLGDSIVPTTFLDKMLQACSLFRIFFSHAKSFDADPQLLNRFVTDMFAAFLTQVKVDLSEMNSSLNDSSPDYDGMEEEQKDTTAVPSDGNTDSDDDFEQIATALTHLIRSTQELANGLALPEVGIDMEIASSMVDQTVELTESMIQRYISIRFHALRDQAVKDCVVPFLRNIMEGKDLSVAEMIRLASVSVAEMMQLADSKIDEVTGILMAAPVENDMVRLSIQKNSCQFALWLASTFEVLAGCDTIIVSGSDHGKKFLHIQDEKEEKDNENMDHSEDMGRRSEDTESMNAFHDKDNTDVDDPLYELVIQMEESFEDDNVSSARMVLALAQVCRMAEKSVIETINSSIASSMQSDTNEKDVRGRFAKKSHGVDVDSSGTISERFQKASERILALYAMDQGAAAATIVCNDIDSEYNDELPRIPEGPLPCMFNVLEIAKTASIDCATIIGGSVMAAPMEPFEAEDSVFNHYSNKTTLSLGGTMAGVHLDVERMFAQKTTIYKDSIKFDRDEVLCSILMITFKAMVERIRICTYSVMAYRQMRVDVELFRHMVPHYVKSDLSGPLLNLLDDIMMNVRDRCLDKDTVGDGSEFYDDDGKMHLPGDILLLYMEEQTELLETFVITEKTEEVES